MQNWTDWGSRYLQSGNYTLDKAINSVVILVVLLGIYALINRILSKRITNPSTTYSWRTGTQYVLFFLGAYLIGRLWIQGVSTIFTVLGLIGAALTISQKELLLNLSAWGAILWRNLFTLGDRIEIGSYHGDVIGKGPLFFTLMEVGNWAQSDQITGRLVKVPNGLVWNHPLANYTRSFPYIWNEIPFLITPDSDWRKAKTVLASIGLKHSKATKEKAQRYRSRNKDEVIEILSLEPTVFVHPVSEAPSGIRLVLRYLCMPNSRSESESTIKEDFLVTIENEASINIRYHHS